MTLVSSDIALQHCQISNGCDHKFSSYQGKLQMAAVEAEGRFCGWIPRNDPILGSRVMKNEKN